MSFKKNNELMVDVKTRKSSVHKTTYQAGISFVIYLNIIEEVKTNQLSIDNEELFEGMIAIAVPITDTAGRFYSSLAIQAPVFRFSLDDAKASVPLLREAAADLSTLIDE